MVIRIMLRAVRRQERGILLFGGTFDPPHLGHARLPAIAADQLGCHRILFIPAAISPHKLEDPPSEPFHRLAMLALAIADVPDAEICTIELDRPGPSFTCDTLEALRDEYPAGEVFRLLIGADQALAFQQWRNWRRILELAEPAVMLRPPMDDAAFNFRMRQVHGPEEADRWTGRTVRVPLMDISSSEIRQRLLAGRSTQDLLDPAVARYIAQHQLYAAAARPS